MTAATTGRSASGQAAAGEAGADPLRDYAVPPGVADELFEAPGRVRPVWQPFLADLRAMDGAEVARRFGRGDAYLREAGVFWRRYSDAGAGERDWPLSHVPVILGDAEWAAISAGLVQRADLLERVCADIYGPQDLVARGFLPADLLARSPEWLRPMMGVRPASGHWLQFLAFEIGRNPDGTWFVLGDRTQAPSGAGFALENRMATSRVFAETFQRANVHRLAGFFRRFRSQLDALGERHRGRGGPSDGAPDRRARPAILTPGPNTDTYSEHVFIARYLGLMLLEGEDLVAQDGRLMVRTVAGPRPVGVLWRRLDAAFADPLELNETSALGCPGLLGAVRSGQLAMVNALGTGVLESRALMAFLPRIAEGWAGAPLALPNIATWWCGDADARAHVRADAAGMMIGPALSTDLPFEPDAVTAPGGGFLDRARGAVDDWIEAEAGALVGQQAVALSTTPAWEDGRLVPRPMTVRVFLARTARGWTVMPGGYARIGRTGDATALAMQRGGSVADVWVSSDAPVAAETLAPADPVFRRAGRSILPARAADNLFWLGRYTERLEGTVRLLRALHLRLAETGDAGDDRVARIAAHLSGFGIDAQRPPADGLMPMIAAATGCAAKVRDRFSPDGWGALRDLGAVLAEMAAGPEPGDEMARALGVALRRIAGFSGLVNENMYRFTGWRFLEIGRALERAHAMAGVLADFACEDAPEGGLDIAVELGDSVMTHRRRYRVATDRATVVDLLALDDRNPRAILFQVRQLRGLVDELPGARDNGLLSPLSRAVLSIDTALSVAEPAAMTTGRLERLQADLAGLSGVLTGTYLS